MELITTSTTMPKFEERVPESPEPPPSPQPPPAATSVVTLSLRAALAVAISLLFGAGALWLFTRNNDGPVQYHPDEWSKAQQLMDPSQERNFNHPLLLLEAARWVNSNYDTPTNGRDVVIAGRWVSAGLAAVGVAALALAAYQWGGFAALLIGGAVVAMCPPMLVYAHYFKEDTALLGGLMLAMLGAGLTVGAKRWWSQLLACVVLGVGCAATASGKYVGAAAAAPCLLAVFIAPVFGSWGRWWWLLLPVRVNLFALFAVATFVTINWRGFQFDGYMPTGILPEWSMKMSEEYEHATKEHHGMALSSPNHYCLAIATGETMAHLWAFMGVGAVAWGIDVIRRRGRGGVVSRWGIVLAAFLGTFMLVLAYNAIPFARYALPITICLYFIAAVMASYAVMQIWRWKWWGGATALTACLVIVVAFQGGRCRNFNDQFANDSRDRLREWIAQNLPRGAVMVIDNYTGLGTVGDPWRRPKQPPLRVQLVQRTTFAADSSMTPQTLAQQGVDYVAVAWMAYSRFFVPQVDGTPGMQRDFDRRKQFYEILFAEGELLHVEAPSPPTHSFTNQEVRVYRISHLRGANQPPPRREGGWLKGLFGG